MEDITHILEHYRETARHLWNTGFLLLDTEQDLWQLHEEYADIAGRLFTALVLSHLGRVDRQTLREDEVAPQPLLFLRVVPSGDSISLLVNRTMPPSGYWDDPVSVISREDADLRFLRYFDFDLVGPRDLEYYLVRIIASPKYPHLIGRDALLRVRDAKVVLDESAAEQPKCDHSIGNG